jgi:hypothetical protein
MDNSAWRGQPEESRSGQYSRDGPAWTVQPRRVSLITRPGQSSLECTDLDKSAGTDQPCQVSWDSSVDRSSLDRSAWTGQTKRSAWTGQPGQGSMGVKWDKSAGPIKVSWNIPAGQVS